MRVLNQYTMIEFNPGLQQVRKAVTTAFWGTLVQRESQSKTNPDPGELFNMLSNHAYIVNTLLPVNENTLIATYDMTEKSYDSLSTVNVVIVSCVTALVRLKFYSFLEKLGDRVLHYDADSIIYISRLGEYELIRQVHFQEK